MRLLQRGVFPGPSTTSTFSLVERDLQNSSYAILSHRWGPDEVTFKDVEDGKAKDKAGGYNKLEFCAAQAARDGLLFCWIDTCCINKDSSAELSTAINSMFKWYENAIKCYVYLPDVRSGPGWEAAFSRSEWFSRGWTLQELLAPPVVEFFSVEGNKLGDKKSLERLIHQASGVSIEALRGKPLSRIEERERFSWTARRETTVEEDAVYCLLGIFDVQMPLVYGEGKQKALARLQREIRSQADPRLHTFKDALWIVPFERNVLFTGREAELIELERRLFAPDYTSKVAITGLGGVGKTQLVLELLYRTKTKHPACLIVWIAATTIDSVDKSYLKVAQQLEIPGHDAEGADVKRLVQDHLSSNEAGQWLLVFDNADNIDMWTMPITATNHGNQNIVGRLRRPSIASRRLIDYLPRSKQGFIVFTTRNREAAVKLAQPNIVTLHELTEAVAAELLEKSLVGIDTANCPEDVSALLAALTFLPLAITQAVAYINAKGVTLSEYVSLLQEKEEEVIDLLSEDFEDDGRYPEVKNPVATTWLISFEQIRQSNALAADYLSFIACINPKDIPQSLLPPGPTRKKELDAIGLLTAYRFISRRSVDAVLDIHRLVHLTTRNWLRQNDVLDEWTEKTIQHFNKVFPNDDHQHRSTWRAYLPHAMYVLAFYSNSEDQESRIALLERCGKCLLRDGRWDEAEALLSEVVIRNKQRFGEEAIGTVMSVHDLASIYWHQGLFDKAEQLQLRVMETSKTKLEADHPNLVTAMNNLATIYMSQERWEEAEQLLVQVIDTNKTKLGTDDLMTLLSMHNLSSLYMDQGRWDKAEQLLVQVLESRKLKLGLDHPDTLLSMNNLASIYMHKGLYDEAEQLLVQTIETYKLKLGIDHSDTLRSIHNLASVHLDQGRWEDAERLELQAIETDEAKLGPDHPDMLMRRHNLACAWKQLGRDAEAIELMEDCVQRQTRVLGAKHSLSSVSLSCLDQWRSEQ